MFVDVVSTMAVSYTHLEGEVCLKITVNSTFDYFAYYLNYGSVLQAYALQKYLIQRGHTVDLIQDYRTNKRALVEEKRNVGFRESYEQKRKAQKSLIAFAKKYIHLTSMPYYSGKQFKLFPPKADCHIAVSYTHLDVYKRQALNNIHFQKLMEKSF